MIAGRTPRLIFSHQKRLLNPNLPKYVPFTQIDGFIALKFDIPVLSSQHVSPTGMTHPTAPPFLQANCHSPSHPFAGLTFKSDHVSKSPDDAVPTANVHEHATGMVMSNLDVSLGDESHGGAGGKLMTRTVPKTDVFLLNTPSPGVGFKLHDGPDGDALALSTDTDTCLAINDTYFMSHGGAEVQLTMPMDMDSQAANLESDACEGGGPRDWLSATSSSLSISLDSLVLWDNFALHTFVSFPCCYPPCTSSTFTFILNINVSCFSISCDHFSFNLFTLSSPTLPLSLFKSFFLTPLQQPPRDFVSPIFFLFIFYLYNRLILCLQIFFRTHPVFPLYSFRILKVTCHLFASIYIMMPAVFWSCYTYSTPFSIFMVSFFLICNLTTLFLLHTFLLSFVSVPRHYHQLS